MQKGDYAVGRTQSNNTKAKLFLFKVTGKTNNQVTGVVEKDCHFANLRSTVEVSTKDIVVNLGPTPVPGKVYGCDTSILHTGRKVHDNFGTIHFFYKPEAELGKKLFAAFDKCAKVLKQHGLDFIIDPSTCVWEVIPFNGEKYAGLYKRSKKPEVRPHTFQIRPEIMPFSEYPYVIYHELGHHLHKEYATGKKLNAAWIRAYNTSIKVEDIKRDKSQELLDMLLGQEDMPSDFRSILSEEDTITYKWILRSISQRHSLSVKELDLLFEADFKDDIRALWPTRGVSKRDLEPIVTEYATKHVNELIAEAIAFRLVGKQLPKNVESLVDKTFSYAKANSEKR